MKKAVDQAIDLALVADMNLHKQNTGHYFQVLYTLNKRFKL
jgi:hypothetical protein